jgi:hypothetical protein
MIYGPVNHYTFYPSLIDLSYPKFLIFILIFSFGLLFEYTLFSYELAIYLNMQFKSPRSWPDSTGRWWKSWREPTLEILRLKVSLGGEEALSSWRFCNMNQLHPGGFKLPEQRQLSFFLDLHTFAIPTALMGCDDSSTESILYIIESSRWTL